MNEIFQPVDFLKQETITNALYPFANAPAGTRFLTFQVKSGIAKFNYDPKTTGAVGGYQDYATGSERTVVQDVEQLKVIDADPASSYVINVVYGGEK